MSKTGEKGKGRSRRDAVMHLLRHGPFAIAASSLQGAVNYAIVVYLIYARGAESVGEYRLMFSCFSLLGLLSVYETSKVFIRSIAANDREATVALFANRLTFSLGTLVLALIGYGISELSGYDFLPIEVVWIALISLFFYPGSSYQSLLQVRSQFFTLFLTEAFKYGAALITFVVMIYMGVPLSQAVLAQFAVMAACHVVYSAVSIREFVDLRVIGRRYWSLIRSRPAGEARTLSLGNLLPASLEHVDKFLVGAVFGLEFLGIYTLAYSTGRFLYNTLKPALYIYYRRFVDRMPGRKLLWLVSGAFTALGAVSSIVFLAALHWIPGLEKFKGGETVTVILFLSYGVGMLHAVYVQAFALNKDTDARHVLWASAAATGLSLFVLGGALLSPPAIAMIVLALQYPIRDGASVAFMAAFRRRSPKP